MNRREFIGFVGVVLACPVAARAQQPAKVAPELAIAMQQSPKRSKRDDLIVWSRDRRWGRE
jgi:hypothetical protein